MTMKRTTSGYTLLELVLVLAILATAIAALAPSLSGFAAGRKAEETARQFVSLTRWARSQAVAEGVTYQLVIDANGGRWWLTVQEADSEAFEDVPGPFGRVYSAPEGVEIRPEMPLINGQQAIIFEPNGRNDIATIRFVGPHNNEVTVACHAPVEDFRILTETEARS